MVKFIIVSLEGNVGAGKSTLFNLIKREFPEAFFLEEPLEAWQCVAGDPSLNMLEKFYEDPVRWGYTFQLLAYQSRLMAWERQFKRWEEMLKARSQHDTPTKECLTQSSEKERELVQLVFTERSIESSRTLFFRLARQLLYISEIEYHMYEEFYAWLMRAYSHFAVDQVIYINTPAEECYRRLTKRGRSEESSVSLDYLRSLEQKHLEWFEEDREKFVLLDIDATENYITDTAIQKRICKQIRESMRDLVSKFEN